ncbi:MAG: type II toxin-antitoxin system HicB family antitoxin [Rhodothermales bacterium]
MTDHATDAMALASRYRLIITGPDEDGEYLVTSPLFPGLSAFGETPTEALDEARVALSGIIKVMNEDGQRLPEPDAEPKSFSGQLRVRLPRSLHAALSYQAEREGVSLNTLILSYLAERSGVQAN